MVMRRLLAGLTALPLLSGIALAAQPVPLTDRQMDVVTAGTATTSGGLSFGTATGAFTISAMVVFFFNEADTANTGTVFVTESGVPCSTCFLAGGVPNLVVQASFGPVP
jgi:hypothetical protein